MSDEPLTALHDALAAATFRDLPDLDYEDRDWEKWKQLSKEEQRDAIRYNTVPMRVSKRRPTTRDIEVTLFNQGWGSTALGYGGIGGAAMTDAYTVVVQCYHRYVCVYFGYDRLAYKLDLTEISPQGRENFLKDLSIHNMASCREAIERYK